MKKVLFLMLFLTLVGTAGLNAQVRIGGNSEPNRAAVLDLNADDGTTPAGNKGALALPRVSLSDAGAALNNETPVAGMMVYNTNASMTGGNGAGIYYWDSGKWVKAAGNVPTYTGSASITLNNNNGIERAALEGDVTAAANSNTTSIAENAVTSDKIAAGAVSTTKLANNSVTSDKIADGTIVAGKLNAMGATAGQVLAYNGTAWTPAASQSTGVVGSAGAIGYVVLPWSGAVIYNAFPDNCRVINVTATSQMPPYSLASGARYWAVTSISGIASQLPTGTTLAEAGLYVSGTTVWIGTLKDVYVGPVSEGCAIPIICL